MSDLAIDPKRVFKTSHGFGDDDLYHKRIVICPLCGGENIHIDGAEVEDGGDDYKTSAPTYRGDLLRSKFSCENGHSFELCFGFHKGNTYTFFRFAGENLDRTDYYEYIKSEAWMERARAAKKRAGNRCQICNSNGILHAHHRTYERLGNELPDDITVLCAECHYLYEKNK